MKRLMYILVAFVLATSCEKIIDFHHSDVVIDGITINALAVADTVFTASVSKAYPFYKVGAISGEGFWIYEGLLQGEYEQFFKDSAIVKDALVKLQVNGTQQYNMKYDPVSYSYKSTYIPKEGDQLKVHVEYGIFPIANAEVQVPQSQKIEVVQWEKVYSKNNYRTDDGDLYDYTGQDTVARVTLRISDSAEESNFYRLKVRGYAHSLYSDGSIAYMHNDIFTSADIIFKDEQLNKGYRGWPAYFSNIFSDHLFNGKDYEFIVESRLRKGDEGTNYIVVELQSITNELYYYLKSTMLYRITEQDAYTEPISIYSNIEDGWGILGAVSSDTHSLRL